jgi:hypothetical protein
VLVEIVRFTQKNGLKGAEGGWKDFLALNDKKYGVSVSDPKKRTKDVLLAFLVTFSKDFQKVLNILVQSQPAVLHCIRSSVSSIRTIVLTIFWALLLVLVLQQVGEAPHGTESDRAVYE